MHPLPDRLATARAILLRPEMVMHLPAVTADAWFRLKAAQGHPVPPSRQDRMTPAHLMRDPDTGTVAYITATCARIIPRVHAHLARQPQGGAA